MAETKEKPDLDPQDEAIASGRSDGDVIVVDENGNPVKVDHPSSSQKIRDAQKQS